MGRASAEVPRRQWVRRTSISVVEISPKNFLLSMFVLKLFQNSIICVCGTGRNRGRVSGSFSHDERVETQGIRDCVCCFHVCFSHQEIERVVRHSFLVWIS